MNNNFKEFLRKNGFFVALSSAVAILLVSAIYFSYNTIGNDKEPIVKDEEPIYEPVNKSDVKSYKENITENTTKGKESKEDSTENTTKGKESKEDSTENTTKGKESKEDSTENTTKGKESKEDNTENTTKGKESKEDSTENTTKDNKASNNDEKPKDDTKNKESNNIDKSFTLFDDSKEMSWPVSGKIVMDYSVETAIYDKTLEQYRTNDSICISTPLGSDVLASAEGVVEEVFTDSEAGKSVVINHGNGWQSTYSQLDENVLVAVGQVVGEGEKIASIGEPTNYTLALGPHLEFKITKDDLSSDPKLVLEQAE